MDKYKNKYRIPSARLQGFDYGSNAAYFITICTKNRAHFFGEIINKEMILSEIGLIAEKFWLEIPNHFPFVELGNFVIMPNHTHGIIIIDKPVETLQSNVSTGEQKNEQMKSISPKSGTISTIVRSYKSVVSKHASLIHADFNWQPRFYDHIIRNASSFDIIQNYIANNPSNWENDKFYD